MSRPGADRDRLVRRARSIRRHHLASDDTKTISKSTVTEIDECHAIPPETWRKITAPALPATATPPPALGLAPCATGVPAALAAMHGAMSELPTIAREYGDGAE